MSAPDPKAWEATGAELWDISGAVAKEAREIIESVARRRALAELMALLAETYVPYVDQHYGGPAPTLLNADVIHARIAAIEAEES